MTCDMESVSLLRDQIAEATRELKQAELKAQSLRDRREDLVNSYREWLTQELKANQ